MFDFLSVGKTLKNFAGELTSIRLEVESLSREMEDIQYAPAHPDDVVKALEVWAADNAAEYRHYLKMEIGKIVHKPAVLLNKNEVKNLLRWGGILPEPAVSNFLTRDVQMCGLLGPASFVELLKKQMEAIDWPAPGLPMAARPAAIAVLEKKISKLRARESDLIQSADKAGLSVS